MSFASDDACQTARDNNSALFDLRTRLTHLPSRCRNLSVRVIVSCRQLLFLPCFGESAENLPRLKWLVPKLLVSPESQSERAILRLPHEP